MKWELLDRKDVRDFDGFWTEYSLYTNGEMFVCVFGDSDYYSPEDSEWDFESFYEDEAEEWFSNYSGFEEDEEWNIEYEEAEESYAGWAQQDVIDMYRMER